MNYKTTFVLVALLAVVGGYFYFVEWGTPSGYQQHEQQRSALSTTKLGTPVFDDDALTANAIDRLQIVRGGATVEAVKEDGGWFQTQPVRFALDGYAPDNVARSFVDLNYLQRIEPGEADNPTLSQMGLDTPRAVVTIHAGDKQWTLRLGRLTMGGRGYVQIQGEPAAYVVDANLHGAVLDQPITQWRNKSLGSPQASGVQRVELHQFGAVITLTKADGRWRLGDQDSPGIQRANNDAVESLVASVGRLYIDQFIEDNPDDLGIYGLNNPYLRIVIQTPPANTDAASAAKEDDEEDNDNEDAQTAAPTTHTLSIGHTDLSGGARYAAWTLDDEPTTVIFTLNAGSAEALQRSADDLRDSSVVTANPRDVRGLTVKQNGRTTLHLVRDPLSGFSFGPTDDPTLDYGPDFSTSNALIQKLCGLVSTQFTTDLKTLGEPIANVRLDLATADGVMHLAIHGTGAQRTIVTEGESIGYIVQASELHTLLGPTLGLRDRTILELTPDQIARIRLRRTDGTTFTFEPQAIADEAHAQAETWELTGYTDFERAPFNALMKLLNPLRIERWLGEPATPSGGWVRFVVEPVGGAPIELQVNPDDGRAVMSGVDLAFMLPKTFVDRLNTEYRDRTVLRLTSDRIESISIADDRDRVTIRRDGQAFITDDANEINQAQAAGVFDVLAGLRVNRYVTPLNLRPQDIDFHVGLTTTEGVTMTLKFVSLEGHATTATIDPEPGDGRGGWFTLPQNVIDTLRAPLTEIQEPVK